MSKPRDSLIWGALLVAVGAALLLWNLGVLASFQVTLVWTLVAVFALLGMAFVFAYLNRRADWWLLIPAFTWFSVAAALLLSSRGVAVTWVAAALLAGIALAFLVIYVSDRAERWWALIPFGSVAVMMAVVLLSAQPQVNLALLGAVLFGGMALVFLMIYILARERQRFAWALVPTATLGVMSLAALAAYAPQGAPVLTEAVRLWPVLLILLGAVLIAYAVLRSRRSAPAVELPPQPVSTETPLAPGASVTTVTEDAPRSKGARYERSPITLMDETPARPATETAASGEVADIYEFLKSAPPENGK